MSEALIESADHVEDEDAVSDDLTEGAEIVGHLLEVAAVLSDGEIALDEVAELYLDLDGTHLLVAEELGLDNKPGVLDNGALGGDDLGEGVEDPGLDHAIHLLVIL